MAIKKSELYSSLWASCDELRGGMDASQYKDYVLFMLFIKYVSDKYGNSDDFEPPVVIPTGASFSDMVALKGKTDIGDKINTQIIQPLIDKNDRLARTDFPDFNDPTKLGEGEDMVARITNLVSIFEKPELDFSDQRADNDDLLGDAYEYLMRHFATESGKSKGQFYTPSEVSRVMAHVIGITPENSVRSTTAYDPTAGSGSLLLKVAAEAGKQITLEGQEMDVTTAGLARMNMILHDFPDAIIQGGSSTLSSPKFKDGEALRTYDYVVANPPFSSKSWSTGLNPENDLYQRFEWGQPPAKQGDYAFLLHIIRSMKSAGKGACILPHGVLFRGNAEAKIRKNLVRSGYLKGIIGLPANLFYGTGIPACILILDKENATARKGIFMLDASKGFMKDGNKNRLRERDLHKIIDVFNNMETHAGYSRLVPHEEISDDRNDFNLNLPRYIDTRETEDLQDIDAHLNGGIPQADIDALEKYWTVCPELREYLFSERRPGYWDVAVGKADLKNAIYAHAQFADFIERMNKHFIQWRDNAERQFKSLKQECLPKQIIFDQSESLLAHYEGQPLLDEYAVFQHIMDYWAETMQDDCYAIAADGWVARTERVTEVVKKTGKIKDKGWVCDLVPKALLIARYFAKEQQRIDELQAELEDIAARKLEMLEEHGGEEGILKDVSSRPDAVIARSEAILALWSDEDKQASDAYTALVEEAKLSAATLAELKDDTYVSALKNVKGTVTLSNLKKRIAALDEHTDSEERVRLSQYLDTEAAYKSKTKTAKNQFIEIEQTYLAKLNDDPLPEAMQDINVANSLIELYDQESEIKVTLNGKSVAGKKVPGLIGQLDKLAYDKYPTLSETEIKTLVVDDKWLTVLEASIHGEMDRISQGLTSRLTELVNRYETSMPELSTRVEQLEGKVNAHLEKMGFAWT